MGKEEVKKTNSDFFSSLLFSLLGVFFAGDISVPSLHIFLLLLLFHHLSFQKAICRTSTAKSKKEREKERERERTDES